MLPQSNMVCGCSNSSPRNQGPESPSLASQWIVDFKVAPLSAVGGGIHRGNMGQPGAPMVMVTGPILLISTENVIYVN